MIQPIEGTTETSRVLALPTEVRNLIYKHLARYAIEDYRAYGGYMLTLDYKEGRTGRQHGLGLLEANRQLREEFLPFYSEHTKLCVTLPYLARMANSLRGQEKMVLPAGNSIIGLPKRPYSSNVDILPLLRAIKRLPDWDYVLTGGMRSLAGLLDVNGNEAWRAAVQEEMLKVDVLIFRGHYRMDPDMILCVKKEHGEDWMKPGSNSYRRREHMDVWLERIGLSAAKLWPGFDVELTHTAAISRAGGYRDDQEEPELVLPAGKIVVGSINHDDKPVTDIIPLLRVCKRIPGLKFHFDTAGERIDAVFNLDEKETWWSTLQKVIRKVRVFPAAYIGGPAMMLHFKKQYRENWMWHNVPNKDNLRDVWLERVGLDDLTTWPTLEVRSEW
ncbi:hypothetical protein EK21DRAFT_112179 [Setomelanomma holmii]|uniref:Uncharacterized protein n=1 Tax=Setomelanomma holmii TaxID=210430 RepID=A0A9P4HBV7_9PLEO|nr:hypothetical protein EK21DRAFT_112179 [Setomelanomma holmii]